MELYRGELIEGLFIADAAPELERWLDVERDRLRRRAYEAAGLAADRYASRGDWTIAIVYARRAAALAPYDEKAIRRLLTILGDLGDRGEAVRTYEAFAQRLSKDYGVEPSVESQALIASVRSRDESGSEPSWSGKTGAVVLGRARDQPDVLGGSLRGSRFTA